MGKRQAVFSATEYVIGTVELKNRRDRTAGYIDQIPVCLTQVYTMPAESVTNGGENAGRDGIRIASAKPPFVLSAFSRPVINKTSHILVVAPPVVD